MQRIHLSSEYSLLECVEELGGDNELFWLVVFATLGISIVLKYTDVSAWRRRVLSSSSLWPGTVTSCGDLHRPA